MRLQSGPAYPSQYPSTYQGSPGWWERKAHHVTLHFTPIRGPECCSLPPFLLLKRFCQTHPPFGAGASSAERVCFL